MRVFASFRRPPARPARMARISPSIETAVSILAEILAVRAGRVGGRLKDAETRIHAAL